MVSIFSQYDDEISTTLLVKGISTINISLESVKIILLSCHSVSCKLQMLLAYSSVPNRRADQNKRAGGKIL